MSLFSPHDSRAYQSGRRGGAAHVLGDALLVACNRSRCSAACGPTELSHAMAGDSLESADRSAGGGGSIGASNCAAAGGGRVVGDAGSAAAGGGGRRGGEDRTVGGATGKPKLAVGGVTVTRRPNRASSSDCIGVCEVAASQTAHSAPSLIPYSMRKATADNGNPGRMASMPTSAS